MIWDTNKTMERTLKNRKQLLPIMLKTLKFKGILVSRGEARLFLCFFKRKN